MIREGGGSGGASVCNGERLKGEEKEEGEEGVEIDGCAFYLLVWWFWGRRWLLGIHACYCMQMCSLSCEVCNLIICNL